MKGNPPERRGGKRFPGMADRFTPPARAVAGCERGAVRRSGLTKVDLALPSFATLRDGECCLNLHLGEPRLRGAPGTLAPA